MRNTSAWASCIALLLCAGCGSPPAMGTEVSMTECSDGVDNDGDGAADCSDSDCRGFCRQDGGGGVDAGATASACGAVPVEGRCAGGNAVEYCGVPTGVGTPQVERFDCGAGETCTVDADGFAACVFSGECRDGTIECMSATGGRQCVSGSWTPLSCPAACVQTAIGDGCAADTSTTSFHGHVTYETRAPNAGLTDWDAPGAVDAQGFLVASFQGDVLLDAVVTSQGSGGVGGQFDIRVPAAPGAGDRVTVLAVGVASDGSLAFVVADPGDGGSGNPRPIDSAPTAPRLWGWSWDTATLVDPELAIDEASGSGAARVFDYLRYVFGETTTFFHSSSTQSVIVWLGLETTWSCGACQWSVPTRVLDADFRYQVFIPGGSDQGYWSDAVTAHEFGHYVMSAYGTSPGEGGPHFVGGVSNPGLAWSEGWATYFSSDIRESSVYYDKQDGGFFWFDIGSRAYSSAVWNRPMADAGLFQSIDENEVAAMVLALRAQIGRDSVWAALETPRATVGPFERGYTSRTWDDPAHPEIFTDTGASAPFLADFFDSVLCGGASAGTIDLVTDPTTHYPYPSGSPLCR